MEIIAGISLILVLVLMRRQYRMAKQLDGLVDDIETLKGNLGSQRVPPAAPVASPHSVAADTEVAVPAEPSVPESVEKPTEAPVYQSIPAVSPPPRSSPAQRPPSRQGPKAKKPTPRKPKTPTLWHDLVERFADNWIGGLGAVTLVLGIIFLGVYAAIQFAPFYRFLMLVGVSIALAGGGFWLQNRPRYASIGAYLTSSGGAVFLFSCLGAGGIPGLQWIDNSWLAFGLLQAGIVVNLGLGYIRHTQLFAALHVLLSLVALAGGMHAAQPGDVWLMGSGAIVAMIGLLFTLRRRWEQHLMLILAGFALFHLHWYLLADQGNAWLPHIHLVAIISVLLVSIGALLVHYQVQFKAEDFDRIPFFTHLATWVLLVLQILPHTLGQKWKTVFLLGGAMSVYWLARKAKQLQIGWLYRMDTLVALLIATIAFATLIDWRFTPIPILALVIGLALIFMILMQAEGEKKLFTVGVGLYQLTMGLLIVWSINRGMEGIRAETLFGGELLILLIVCVAGLFIGLLPYLPINRITLWPQPFWELDNEGGRYSLADILPMLLVPVMVSWLHGTVWLPVAGASGWLLLLFIKSKIPSESFRAGLWIVAASLLILWTDWAMAHSSLATWQLLGSGLLFVLPPMLSLTFAWEGKKWPSSIVALAYLLPLLLFAVPVSAWVWGLGIILLGGLAIWRYQSHKPDFWVFGLLFPLSVSAWWQGLSFVGNYWLVFIIPLSLLLIYGIYSATDRHKTLQNWLWYGLGFHFLCVLAKAFVEQGIWIGNSWLFGALAFLVLGNSLYPLLMRKPSWTHWPPAVWRISYGYLLLGLVTTYFTMSWEASPEKWLIFGAGLLALAGWHLAQGPAAARGNRFWRIGHASGAELSIIWLIASGTQLLDPIWQPLLWVGLALGSLLAGHLWPRYARLRAYALGLNALAAIGTIGISVEYLSISASWQTSIWWALIISLLGQFIYIYFGYRYTKLQDIFPASTAKNILPYLLLYPTLLALGATFFQGFETQLLTLLWMLECLLIFALSIVLRDQVFRYTAMAIVIVCMIRLPFFDLRDASTLERALSLVGVGLILILMDFIYKRFKDRFLPLRTAPLVQESEGPPDAEAKSE